MSDAPDIKQLRRRDAVLLLLTFAAGSVDALSFLGFGVFGGMQTGNLLLLGFGIGRGEPARIVLSIVSMLGFAAGVLLAHGLLGGRAPDKPWPKQATRALLVELLLLAGFTAGWMLRGPSPGTGQLPLLASGALAMGLQLMIARHLARWTSPPTFVSGAPFVTVTLATFVDHLLSGSFRDWGPYAATLIVFVGGGAVGAFLLYHVFVFAPLLSLATLLLALAVALG